MAESIETCTCDHFIPARNLLVVFIQMNDLEDLTLTGEGSRARASPRLPPRDVHLVPVLVPQPPAVARLAPVVEKVWQNLHFLTTLVSCRNLVNSAGVPTLGKTSYYTHEVVKDDLCSL